MKQREGTVRQEPAAESLPDLDFWQTVFLLADSWQREINYNDVMRRNYDVLYKKTGQHGTDWVIANGSVKALVFYFIRKSVIWIIPRGYLRIIMNTYMLYYIGSRCFRIDAGLQSLKAPKSFQNISKYFWIIWLIICLLFFKPENQWLADYALRRHILGVIAAFLQYAKADDDLHWNIIHWQAQLKAIAAYTLTSYLLYSANAIARLQHIAFWYLNFSFYWALLASDTRLIASGWVLLERICSYTGQRYWLEISSLVLIGIGPFIYSTYSYLIDTGALRRPSTRIPQRIKIFLVKQTYIFDRLDLCEALLLYTFPTLLIRMAHGAHQTKQIDLFNDEEKAKIYKRWTGNNFPVGENPKEIKVQDYEYQPLAEDEIRILVLGPMTSIFQDIPARLEHHKLTDLTNYEALSYCWGDQELSEELTISGKRLPITLSALDLLVARCALGKERRVWIDAVCINQKDSVEKAHQVSKMVSIYAQADRVILFPMPLSSGRVAAGLLYEIKCMPQAFAYNHDLHLRGLLTNTSLDLKTTTLRWRAVANLLTNIYFSRAWIIQEIVAAKAPEFYLGGYYMSWKDFCIAIERLSMAEYIHSIAAMSYGANPPSDYIGVRINAIIMINALRTEDAFNGRALSREQLKKLDNLLDIAAEFNSTDPRDKIYSLIGMSTDKFVVPDYNRDYLDVLKEVTRRLYEDQRIDLLAMAGTGYTGAHSISWLPDLARKRPPPFTVPHMKKPRFQPSTTPANISVQSDSISVSGFVFDKLMDLSDNMMQRGANILDAKVLLKFHKAALELAGRYNKTDREITLTMVAEKEQSTVFETDQVQDETWADNASRRYTEYLEAEIEAGTNSTDQLSFLARTFRGYTRACQQACDGRRFGITEQGRLCMIPELALPGDLVCILYGAQSPYVLRPLGDQYRLIGEVYVHGQMHGEAVCQSVSTFVLV